MFQESAAFLESIICSGPVNASERLSNHYPGASVYPNPFVDILNIETEAKIQAVTVIKLIGQTCLDLRYTSDYQLKISKLPKGSISYSPEKRPGYFCIKSCEGIKQGWLQSK